MYTAGKCNVYCKGGLELVMWKSTLLVHILNSLQDMNKKLGLHGIVTGL